MLIEFAVTNYRSFRERQVLSFQSSGQVSKKELSDNLIVPSEKSHGGTLLKTAVLYGANASGKSNLPKAIKALKEMVLESDSYRLDKPIPEYDPFRLEKKYQFLPSIFEVDFVAKDRRRYQYLIEFDQKTVRREELYFFEVNRSLNRPRLLFKRGVNVESEFGDAYRGKKDFALLEHQLLLTRAGLEALPSLTPAYRFFSTYLFYAAAQTSQFDEMMLQQMGAGILADDTNDWHREAVISLVKAADTGISNIFVEVAEPKIKFSKDVPPELRQQLIERLSHQIKTIHPVLVDGVEIDKVVFDLSDESTGTRKFLGVAGFVTDALHDGSIVIVDELDKNLHPLLTRMIIQLFQSQDTNPNNAQLIFSTHDVSLIDRELFRLDQIVIIDKELTGETVIGRLSDFKGISKIRPLMKWYMLGMFKGIPATNPYQINLRFETKAEYD